MCLQCVVQAEYVDETFLDGFALMRATNANAPEEWPMGALGLIECNDPTYVFTVPILPQPIPPDGDEDSDDPVYHEAMTTYTQAVWNLSEELAHYPMTTWKLMYSAIQAGFDPVERYRDPEEEAKYIAMNFRPRMFKNDWEFADWLMKRLYDSCNS